MRVVDLFSAFLLLLVLLLSSPCHAQNSSSTTDDSSNLSSSSDSDTESSPMTNESTTPTTTSSPTTTDSTTSGTESSPTTTDSNASPSGDTSSPPTITTPPPDLKLFEDTRQELNEITDIIDAFIYLVNSDSAPSPVASASAGGLRGHPVGWWRLGTQTRALKEDSFCSSGAGTETCARLNEELNTIDDLVAPLQENADDWRKSNLIDLRVAKMELQQTYISASQEPDNFRNSVIKPAFNTRISQVKQNVQAASDSVAAKITNLTPETQDSGSVILVAVIGAIGGLLMVAIISVMIYGAVMRVKTKKKLSSAPYSMMKGENILEDGLASDGPGSRHDSRMDPYSRPVASSVHSDPYAAPYNRRNEPNYRAPIVPRPRQGLPRTQF